MGEFTPNPAIQTAADEAALHFKLHPETPDVSDFGQLDAASQPPRRVTVDEFRLEPGSSQGDRLLAAVLRELRTLTSEVRGLREDQGGRRDGPAKQRPSARRPAG